MEGENLLELLHSSLKLDASSGDNGHLKEILESCLEHGSFYVKAGSETVVKTINSNLNDSFNKDKGLILLLAYLPQLSNETFLNNAVSWMALCNKMMSQKGSLAEILGLKAFAALIKISGKFPDISKETAKHIVPKFLSDHFRKKPRIQAHEELLKCVEVCMSHYPGPSGEYKSDIANLLMRVVGKGMERGGTAEQVAARCVPLLAQVGGGGKQGGTHRTAWHAQHLALVSLLHTILNDLYEHLDCQSDVPDVPSGAPHLSVDSIDEIDSVCKAQKLAGQFSTVSLYLQTMLLQQFPVAKTVAPEAIFDLIVQAQKPTQLVLGSSQEVLAVKSVLPNILTSTLRLLESLILCLGRKLVSYGPLICQLCTQVIVWTNHQHPNWPYTLDKPYSLSRGAAYSCFTKWLSVAGGLTLLDSFSDKVLPVLLADVRPGKPTVRLRVAAKSKKGKKKQDMLVGVDELSDKPQASAANLRLCSLGLQLLTSLIRSANPTLKTDDYKEVTDEVLSLATELMVPYRDADCLTYLYQLVLALCLDPHPSLSIPLAPALAVFSAGSHSCQPKVRDTCVLALSSLEKIIRPTAATLYFPVPSDNQVNTFQEEENTQSDVEEENSQSVIEEGSSQSDIAEENSQSAIEEENSQSDIEEVTAKRQKLNGDDDFLVEKSIFISHEEDLEEVEKQSTLNLNVFSPNYDDDDVIEVIDLEDEVELNVVDKVMETETVHIEINHNDKEESDHLSIKSGCAKSEDNEEELYKSSQCENEFMQVDSVVENEDCTSRNENISNGLIEPQSLPKVSDESTVETVNDTIVLVDENDDEEFAAMLLDFKDVC